MSGLEVSGLQRVYFRFLQSFASLEWAGYVMTSARQGRQTERQTARDLFCLGNQIEQHRRRVHSDDSIAVTACSRVMISAEKLTWRVLKIEDEALASHKVSKLTMARAKFGQSLSRNYIRSLHGLRRQ